jgi:hypothetical protein
MRLYKRGKTYWFELVFEGQRYQQSTKEKTESKRKVSPQPSGWH